MAHTPSLPALKRENFFNLSHCTRDVQGRRLLVFECLGNALLRFFFFVLGSSSCLCQVSRDAAFVLKKELSRLFLTTYCAVGTKLILASRKRFNSYITLDVSLLGYLR